MFIFSHSHHEAESPAGQKQNQGPQAQQLQQPGLDLDSGPNTKPLESPDSAFWASTSTVPPDLLPPSPSPECHDRPRGPRKPLEPDAAGAAQHEATACW